MMALFDLFAQQFTLEKFTGRAEGIKLVAGGVREILEKFAST
jgi:hypothetical protein